MDLMPSLDQPWVSVRLHKICDALHSFICLVVSLARQKQIIVASNLIWNAIVCHGDALYVHVASPFQSVSPTEASPIFVALWSVVRYLQY